MFSVTELSCCLNETLNRPETREFPTFTKEGFKLSRRSQPTLSEAWIQRGLLSEESLSKDTNLIVCSADLRSADWLSNRGFWSQTETKWGSVAGGAGGAGFIEDTGPSGSHGSSWGGSASWLTSAALKASARTSSSALIRTSRDGRASPDLRTTECCFTHRSDGGWYILTLGPLLGQWRVSVPREGTRLLAAASLGVPAKRPQQAQMLWVADSHPGV